MERLDHLLKTLGSMPLDYLVVIGGFALAGFAIHAVYSIARDRSGK